MVNIIQNLATLALRPQYSKPNTIKSNIQIDQNYLRRMVKDLSFERIFETSANEVARELILDEIHEAVARYDFHRAQHIKEPSIVPQIDKLYNVCVGNPHTAKILIGAHYDSVPNSPGADDNASAVAVLLAVMKSVGFDKEVCYVFFNCEEYGLAGSKYFVENLGPNKLKQVHVLEMVGYTDQTPGSQQNPLPVVALTDVGDFIGLVSNDRSVLTNIVKHAGIMSVPAIGLTIPSLQLVERFSPDLLRSDHTSFWKAKIPAVMWTDTSNFRNPNYHAPTDTPDTLDYNFMAEVAKLLIHLCLEEK